MSSVRDTGPFENMFTSGVVLRVGLCAALLPISLAFSLVLAPVGGIVTSIVLKMLLVVIYLRNGLYFVCSCFV